MTGRILVKIDIKYTLEEMWKQIDEDIENEKNMEIERQENEKNRIEQEINKKHLYFFCNSLSKQLNLDY